MDEEYLKMVLALPDEFFEGWEWKEGDQFYIKGYGEHTCFIGDAVLFKKKPHYWKGYLVYGDWDYFKLIPIPNQEQLQKKCIDFENIDKRYTHSNDYSISKRFIALVIEGDLVKNIEEKTLNEMWLEFVMYLKYHKRWDGEKWL